MSLKEESPMWSEHILPFIMSMAAMYALLNLKKVLLLGCALLIKEEQLVASDNVAYSV